MYFFGCYVSSSMHITAHSIINNIGLSFVLFFYQQPQRLSCCCATMVSRPPRVVVGLAGPWRGLPRLLPRLTALQPWCSLVLDYFSSVSFGSSLELLYFWSTRATVSWLSLVDVQLCWCMYNWGLDLVVLLPVDIVTTYIVTACLFSF
jgi:hypothetical protein